MVPSFLPTFKLASSPSQTQLLTLVLRCRSFPLITPFSPTTLRHLDLSQLVHGNYGNSYDRLMEIMRPIFPFLTRLQLSSN